MEDLRKELVKLKADVLNAQAARMGLSAPGEGVSPKAMRTIEESVAGLSADDLRKELARWTDLYRKVAPQDFKKP